MIKVVNFACYLVCIVIVIIDIIHNISTFFKNEDLCEVRYKPFHDDQTAIYPSLTMCLNTPFSQNDVIPSLGSIDGSSNYESYLIGQNHTNEDFYKVEYENVSLQEKDFLIGVVVKNKDSQIMNQEWKKYVSAQTWGWYFGIMKCFTFDVPFQKDTKVSLMKLSINNSVFPNGIRPKDGWMSRGMQFFFHLPKQFIRSFPTNKRFWSGKKSNRNSYRLRFTLLEMEILRKRDKREGTCQKNEVMQYDELMLYYIIKEVRCRPPYWEQKPGWDEYPVCKRKQDLEQVTNLFWNFFYGKNESNTPCTEIKKLDIKYQESATDESTPPNTTRIDFYYYKCNEYKEIRQMQAYTGMMVVGNIGGFVGMLLGFALVQIPGLVHNGFHYMKNAFFNAK